MDHLPHVILYKHYFNLFKESRSFFWRKDDSAPLPECSAGRDIKDCQPTSSRCVCSLLKLLGISILLGLKNTIAVHSLSGPCSPGLRGGRKVQWSASFFHKALLSTSNNKALAL
jgi:hypothetical protein